MSWPFAGTISGVKAGMNRPVYVSQGRAVSDRHHRHPPLKGFEKALSGVGGSSITM